MASASLIRRELGISLYMTSMTMTGSRGTIPNLPRLGMKALFHPETLAMCVTEIMIIFMNYAKFHQKIPLRSFVL